MEAAWGSQGPGEFEPHALLPSLVPTLSVSIMFRMCRSAEGTATVELHADIPSIGAVWGLREEQGCFLGMANPA